MVTLRVFSKTMTTEYSPDTFWRIEKRTKTWLEMPGRSVDQNTSLHVCILLILFQASSTFSSSQSQAVSTFRKCMVLATVSVFPKADFLRRPAGCAAFLLSSSLFPMGHTVYVHIKFCAQPKLKETTKLTTRRSRINNREKLPTAKIIWIVIVAEYTFS